MLSENDATRKKLTRRAKLSFIPILLNLLFIGGHMRKHFFHLFIVTVILGTSIYSNAFADAHAALYEQQCHELITNADKLSDSDRLHKLFSWNWDYLMHDKPEWATDVGYKGVDDLWTDNSAAALKKREELTHLTVTTAKSITRSALSETDQFNYDLFLQDANLEEEKLRFPTQLIPMTQLDGMVLDSIQLLSSMSTATVKDYENILSRVNRLGTLIDQGVALMHEGLEKKITLPKITLVNVPKQVQDQISDDPLKSPALKPFTEFSKDIPTAERTRLTVAAEEAYTKNLRPAFERLHEFLVKTYIPGARETISWNDLPGGKDWYLYMVKYRTTTALTPNEIHAIGIKEVARIHAEMQEVMEQTGFKGTLLEFFKFMRTDPRFFFTKKADLLEAYRDIAKRADPELIKLFGRLPRLPYGVEPVPEYSEKSQTTAYYMPGSLNAGRPGVFFANTYDLSSRPKWEMEALTLHEAVPGHHLQIALARELEDLPEFRKEGDYTAFIEGWGLYSESLGEELGFYKDPYAKFGRLTYEMWRAIRLVVDTGIHSMGWTRQQAIDYFKANAGKSEHDIAVEVDRYIVWPGQALAYKIGELKIKELRALTKKEQGDAFDIRSFHDHVLSNGPLPLDVLESRIKSWSQRVKKTGS